MKKFLVLYMADLAAMADMMKNSTPEQRQKGIEARTKWMESTPGVARRSRSAGRDD